MTSAVITDTHAHVFWQSFDEDRAEVLRRAREAGVGRMVIVGTDRASSEASFALCADEPGLYPTAGVHPHDAAGSDVETRAAILAAGHARLRPILMTTATTVLGLLPLTGWLAGVPLIGELGAGEGAELRAPMAVTVIAGLVSSTLLTLLVIPVVYQLAAFRWRPGEATSPASEAQPAS